ncbi:MAG: hypothetical protein NTW07_10590 [candidate division Zixibacteria bacterium]|nr:hypothetical protein [candidate division Zixibacteria bacterium]
MNKAGRIIQLINLLNTRHRVTLKGIEKTCRIPERTAYRYLNTISEADVPVYFDEDEGAYRLSSRPGVLINDVTFGEAVLVLLSLKCLRTLVNDHYSEDLDRLITKAVVRQEWEVESVLGPAAEKLTDPLKGIDLSEELTSALIHAAICCGRKVRVTALGKRVKIAKPGLLFNGDWQLVERASDDTTTLTRKAVQKVEVV